MAWRLLPSSDWAPWRLYLVYLSSNMRPAAKILLMGILSAGPVAASSPALEDIAASARQSKQACFALADLRCRLSRGAPSGGTTRPCQFLFNYSQSAIALGRCFYLFDDVFIIGDKLDGAEEIGGRFSSNAGMFTFRRKIDGFGNTLYFANFGLFEKLLLQSLYGCVFGSLVAQN